MIELFLVGGTTIGVLVAWKWQHIVGYVDFFQAKPWDW